MNNSHDVLYNLKVSGNLPSMPQVLVQLIDSCHDPEVKLQTIARIVEKDAAISAKLLQLVNSALIGTRKTFSGIEQAVVYLGADTVRNLAVSVSVQQVFRRVETNGQLSIDKFWHHSYLNAVLARKIADLTDYPHPSEAYLSGLLHDIGKLLLWMAFPGKYAPLLLKGVRCTNGRLAFLESEKLHINHCEAGAWLCEQWCLPTLVADAIRYHHHPLDEVETALPLTKIASLADLLSHSDTSDPETLEAAQRFFQLSPTQVETLYHGLDEHIAAIADQLGIRIPQTATTSHDQEPECEKMHRETSLGLINRVRNITQINGVLETLLRAENTEAIVDAVEQGLKILFNEDTCLVLLLDATTGALHAHASPNNKLIRETAGFTLFLERHGNSLPAQAVQQQRILHSFMNKSENKGSTHLLDAQLLHLLGTEGMLALPMVYRDEFQGLILIGLMERSHRSLSGQTQSLRLLANHAAITLYLERIKSVQAERIAAERVQSAALVAKKIAHEINNPLATLRNYIYILGGKNTKGEAIDNELAIIDQELERIGHITLGLEDLACEQADLNQETTNLHRHLEETLRLHQPPPGGDNQISLTYVPWEQPLTIRTDVRCLRQIMQNLIGNAVDALTGQGRIIVRTVSRGGTVEISVEDNGPGIDPSLGDNLFTTGTSTKKGRHGGFGLAIVNKLVHRLGGTIGYESSPGRTVFTLTLPA
jgi:HD-like signal output (HDOD) protein/signal transduction histidine kinase